MLGVLIEEEAAALAYTYNKNSSVMLVIYFNIKVMLI